MRGATIYDIPEKRQPESHFNSHAPCGAQRVTPFSATVGCTCISTHTPHAGRNSRIWDNGTVPCNFNSHAPCGAQLYAYSRSLPSGLIISTHTPHAGRNVVVKLDYYREVDFNSHAPCGAQLCASPSVCRSWCNFNSHAPCGAQRLLMLERPSMLRISTHTPHAGRNVLMASAHAI